MTLMHAHCTHTNENNAVGWRRERERKKITAFMSNVQCVIGLCKKFIEFQLKQSTNENTTTEKSAISNNYLRWDKKIWWQFGRTNRGRNEKSTQFPVKCDAIIFIILLEFNIPNDKMGIGSMRHMQFVWSLKWPHIKPMKRKRVAKRCWHIRPCTENTAVRTVHCVHGRTLAGRTRSPSVKLDNNIKLLIDRFQWFPAI